MTVERHVEERFFLGLDLGQRMDFSALVALAQWPLPGKTGRSRMKYETRGVKRWPLQTSYTAIARDVARLCAEPPLAGCTLGVDVTGVGLAVLELVRAEKPRVGRLLPVLITAGFHVNYENGTLHVPKPELCSTVASLLDSDRLSIPATIPEAEVLGRELLAFKVKITLAGNERMEAGELLRQRPHDDLVIGLALAAFLGERAAQYDTGGEGPIVLAERADTYGQYHAAPGGKTGALGYGSEGPWGTGGFGGPQ